jgi:hypothetical protein
MNKKKKSKTKRTATKSASEVFEITTVPGIMGENATVVLALGKTEKVALAKVANAIGFELGKQIDKGTAGQAGARSVYRATIDGGAFGGKSEHLVTVKRAKIL